MRVGERSVPPTLANQQAKRKASVVPMSVMTGPTVDVAAMVEPDMSIGTMPIPTVVERTSVASVTTVNGRGIPLVIGIRGRTIPAIVPSAVPPSPTPIRLSGEALDG
jgi:hypothetical protein